ncbi:hypothetical protein HDU76_003420 [Blyttiomyces sp. JEL0837]|nr:hypothetical protein HDU76_003420 [Blyttiomyces sp. JEL0837]
MFTFAPGFEAATLKFPTNVDADDGIPQYKKQIIGFAKFRTRLEALQARDHLSGRKVDAERGSLLKAEIAKKNLHTKRGISNDYNAAMGPNFPSAFTPINTMPPVNALTSMGPVNPLGGNMTPPQLGNMQPMMNLTVNTNNNAPVRRIVPGTKEMSMSDPFYLHSPLPKDLLPTNSAAPAAAPFSSFDFYSSPPPEVSLFNRRGSPSSESSMTDSTTGPAKAALDLVNELRIPVPQSGSAPSRPSLLDSPRFERTFPDLTLTMDNGTSSSVPPSVFNSLGRSERGFSSALFSSESLLGLSNNRVPPSPLTINTSPLTINTNLAGLGSGLNSAALQSPTSASAMSPTFSAPGYRSLADQNPPCNTLYVGNLPANTSEMELRDLFSKRVGYKRLCFRHRPNGPMCFVEFEDAHCAQVVLNELHGAQLSNSVKGGIRLSFSKNPLGVRQNSLASPLNPMSGFEKDSGRLIFSC